MRLVKYSMFICYNVIFIIILCRVIKIVHREASSCKNMAVSRSIACACSCWEKRSSLENVKSSWSVNPLWSQRVTMNLGVHQDPAWYHLTAKESPFMVCVVLHWGQLSLSSWGWGLVRICWMDTHAQCHLDLLSVASWTELYPVEKGAVYNYTDECIFSGVIILPPMFL